MFIQAIGKIFILQCPKIFYRNSLANSVNPDQTAPREQFDQGLHFLSFCKHCGKRPLVRTKDTYGNWFICPDIRIFVVILVMAKIAIMDFSNFDIKTIIM